MNKYIRTIKYSFFIFCIVIFTCTYSFSETTEDLDIDSKELESIWKLDKKPAITYEDEDLAINDYFKSDQITYKTTINLKTTVQEINDDSKLNPDNTILNEDDHFNSIELKTDISYSPFEDVNWHLKLFGLRSTDQIEDDSEEGKSQLRIDELCLDFKLEDFYFVIGKKRINWGHALAFNTVNVLVPAKDPYDPLLVTEGHPILLANYNIGLFNIDFIGTRDYDRDWDGDLSRWGTKIGLVFERSDLAFYLLGGEDYENGSDYEEMKAFSFSTALLDDWLFYTELANFSNNYKNYYNADGSIFYKDSSYYKFVIGTQYQFNTTTSFIFEWLHNNAGYSNTERENYYKLVESMTSLHSTPLVSEVLEEQEFTEMGKNYLFLSCDKSLIEKLNLKLQAILGEDSSYNIVFTTKYNISDFFVFEFMVKEFGGDSQSEFGNNPIKREFELSLSTSF